MRSLRWHLLTLLYLNPELNKDKFTKLANYITNKDNGFVTFNKRPCGIHGIIDKFLKGNRNIPPHNKIRKIVAENCGLSHGCDRFDSYIRLESQTQTGAGFLKSIFLLVEESGREGATLYPYIYDIFLFK